MMCSDPYVRPVVADVDVLGDGRRWWLQDCDGLPVEPPIVLNGIDPKPLTSRDWSRALAATLRWERESGTVWASTSAKREPIPRVVLFDDTPGPDGAGPKSGIMIEVPAEGWPDNWRRSAIYDGYRIQSGGCCLVTNDEHGRRAAWALVTP